MPRYTQIKKRVASALVRAKIVLALLRAKVALVPRLDILQRVEML